jgi:hypothetical protein
MPPRKTKKALNNLKKVNNNNRIKKYNVNQIARTKQATIAIKIYSDFLKRKMNKEKTLRMLYYIKEAWNTKLENLKNHPNFNKNYYFEIKKFINSINSAIKNKKIPDMEIFELEYNISKNSGIKISTKDLKHELYKTRLRNHTLEYEIIKDTPSDLLSKNEIMYSYILKDIIEMHKKAIKENRVLSKEEEKRYMKFLDYRE